MQDLGMSRNVFLALFVVVIVTMFLRNFCTQEINELFVIPVSKYTLARTGMNKAFWFSVASLMSLKVPLSSLDYT